MKQFNELTEKEINNLTQEEIDMYVKLIKAENGIKIIQKPLVPDYFKVKEPDITVYYTEKFGKQLVFEDLKEAEKLVQTLTSFETVSQSDYNYDLGSENHYLKPAFESNYGRRWDDIQSMKVYSKELWNEVHELVKQNSILKKKYESEKSEYNKSLDDSLEFTTQITDKVTEIKTKFHKMNDYAYKMKHDYMLLSDNNEKIAINFLNKAFYLTEEEKEYVLSNYKDM